MNDWKKRLDIVYSTNPDYHYNESEPEDVETLANEKQQLKISLDKRNRKGKSVTLVSGFVGSDEDATALGKLLKTKCGVGGSVKDNEIIIQGDHRNKILEILKEQGYTKSKII
ncbi:MAG: translation initiation factor [Fermentimonas sp.]